MTTYFFRLFVFGQTERSVAAQANLRMLCESLLPGRYRVEVVDVAEHPDVADQERVLATPMVVRMAPLPRYRVIGDLSDHRRMATALGLPEEAPPTPLGDEA
ncbi:circadian clock KaiB family protein [Kutzneria buriramensis]|uniref:Circadian clock protein KaiB n=1 Tax=Kutzneria buriramensis TaxID=1045776 RepID=A0A3E0I5D4_9PSEU|nr:circadian clock KaiB family protein [Kutzneria buriramensis]REH53952.1 circadian clock protein KaiB [Kutzneria buriramensis]